MRRRVSLDELDHFEQDDNGHLYWKGNKLILEQRLVISQAVNGAIIATGAGAAVTAAMSVISYLWPFVPH